MTSPLAGFARSLLSGKDPRGPGKTPLPHPPRLLLEGFVLLIVIGTSLLKLPQATTEPISLLEAAFTATSAVTVTGLTVVDTGTQFTLFGQLVILALIQLGGLGLMTFAVLTAVTLGFKLRLRHQMLAQEAFNELSLQDARRAAVSIALFALITEAVGVAILSLFFVPELGLVQGIYQAVFYTVSAFNNAGFSLSADSLMQWHGHPGILLTISLLFILGGLGYIVVMEVVEKRRWRRLSVYARIILLATLIINLIAVAAVWLLEHNNPLTLGSMDSLGDQLLAAWFQATTPRTAGFNTLDTGSLTMATCLLIMALMFIGGAPNSTASGIKLSTVAVLMATTRAFLKGNDTVSLRKRTLSNDMVMKALATTAIGLLVVFLATFALSLTVKDDFLDILFEVISAFGTVGLSRGTTDELGVSGQLIIMLVMLIGRLGPLTLGYMLMVRKPSSVKYAKVEFPVG